MLFKIPINQSLKWTQERTKGARKVQTHQHRWLDPPHLKRSVQPVESQSYPSRSSLNKEIVRGWGLRPATGSYSFFYTLPWRSVALISVLYDKIRDYIRSKNSKFAISFEFPILFTPKTSNPHRVRRGRTGKRNFLDPAQKWFSQFWSVPHCHHQHHLLEQILWYLGIKCSAYRVEKISFYPGPKNQFEKAYWPSNGIGPQDLKFS